MANFDTGVADYIYTTATVKVDFPIDFHGNASIACVWCRYFNHPYRTCKLNKEICEYPEKYVGSHCPLEVVDNDK